MTTPGIPSGAHCETIGRTMRAPLSVFAAVSLLALSEPARADVERAAAGFVFVKPASGKAVLREGPSATAKVVGEPPAGARLVYRKVSEAAGKATWFRVEPPGGTPGWIAAQDTSATRPTAPPPGRPVKIVDSGLGNPRPTSAQTAAARGLADGAKRYASAKQELKASVDQFLTLEQTVEELFLDPHHPETGAYPDSDPGGTRKAKAAAFRAGLK